MKLHAIRRAKGPDLRGAQVTALVMPAPQRAAETARVGGGRGRGVVERMVLGLIGLADQTRGRSVPELAQVVAVLVATIGSGQASEPGPVRGVDGIVRVRVGPGRVAGRRQQAEAPRVAHGVCLGLALAPRADVRVGVMRASHEVPPGATVGRVEDDRSDLRAARADGARAAHGGMRAVPARRAIDLVEGVLGPDAGRVSAGAGAQGRQRVDVSRERAAVQPGAKVEGRVALRVLRHGGNVATRQGGPSRVAVAIVVCGVARITKAALKYRARGFGGLRGRRVRETGRAGKNVQRGVAPSRRPQILAVAGPPLVRRKKLAVADGMIDRVRRVVHAPAWVLGTVRRERHGFVELRERLPIAAVGRGSPTAGGVAPVAATVVANVVGHHAIERHGAMGPSGSIVRRAEATLGLEVATATGR